MIAYQTAQPDSATDLVRKAIAVKPDAALYHANLGVVLNSIGQFDLAIESYRSALMLHPAHAETHCNLAITLAAERKYHEATPHFQTALSLAPNNPHNHLNFGMALAEQGDLTQASIHYHRAISLKPDYAEAFSNLGNALQAQGNLDDSLASYHRALSLQPHNVNALYNLATNYQRLNRLDEALKIYNNILLLQPDNPNALYGKSLAQLLAGNFNEGWRNYENRFRTNECKLRSFHPYPHWQGGSLPSGALLVQAEQGIGDEIMFASLLPDLLKSQVQVVLECDPRLVPLIARSFPAVRVVSAFNAAQHSDLNIAAQIPIGSLPAVFRRTQEAFAATTRAYLRPTSSLRDQFRSRYNCGKLFDRCGVAYQQRKNRTQSLCPFALARSSLFKSGCFLDQPPVGRPLGPRNPVRTFECAVAGGPNRRPDD